MLQENRIKINSSSILGI